MVKAGAASQATLIVTSRDAPIHIEAEAKWVPFVRRHVQCIFLNENV